MKNEIKPKIIFMGTPEFGAVVLEKLIEVKYQPVLVVTAPDKPVGRKQTLTPSPVKIIAKKNNIPVEQPETIKNWKLKIENLNPDLGIVAAYGQIIPKNILDIPKYGFLNVHPSLLPKYRGSSPIQYTILNGDKETGITIILMDEKMDHGPIVANHKLGIKNYEYTCKELEKELVNLGAKLIVETIPKWIKGKIKPKPQDDSKTTYTKIIKKEDGRIDWQKSAQDIERQIRAFFPWPGSFTLWEKATKLIKIKVSKVRILKSIDTKKYSIGKVLVAPQNELCVQTGNGFLIVEKLQMEGKKETGSEDFLRGHIDFIGTILK